MKFKHLGKDVTIREWVRFVRPENIWIGDYTTIDDFVLLAGGRGDQITRIGRYVHIAPFSSILGSPGSILGDFVTIAPGCHLFSASDVYVGGSLMSHQIPMKYRAFTSGQIVLGQFVAIGANSVILPGVTIGEGAAVGACSLVTKDLEPWTVNVGVPTRVLKPRERDRILRLAEEFLEEIQLSNG